jgi:hypothetical protein
MEREHVRTVAADLVPVMPMSAPSLPAGFFYIDMIYEDKYRLLLAE